MTKLFAPIKYSGQFATVHFCGQWQLTIWQFGRAIGHKSYDYISEIIPDLARLDLRYTADSRVFDEDVLLAA